VAHEEEGEVAVKILLARGQQQLLKRWLRHAENLSDTEEEMIHICEPENWETPQ
jgi:hypothetical protein